MAEESSFKSIDPRITCTDDIDDLIGYSLEYQHMFKKETAPWEMRNWMEDELDNFRIDYRKIERVYYIHFRDGYFSQDYKLIARMIYKSQSLYIAMGATYDRKEGFSRYGGGRIYVSRDAHMFMNTVLDERFLYVMNRIYESLMVDGIDAVWKSRYDTAWRKKMATNPPMLTFLCHSSIVERQMPREYYSNVLPKILVDSVDDHKKTQIARKNYDDM